MMPDVAMSRKRMALGAVLALVVLSAGAATITYAVANGALDGRPAAASAATPAIGRAQPPRVADLMTRAHCAGAVIGTQLYSRETGRCTYRGVTVTIAAFETGDLRDRWVGAARQFGGTFVVGQLWAAMVERPDQAGQLARTLGGTLA